MYPTEQKLREAKLREQIEQNKQVAEPATGFVGKSVTSEQCPASLRERVFMQLDRAQQEARKAYQLEELAHLLDKNPDIARILDLVELVRG